MKVLYFVIKIEEIIKLLPHRYPMLLVDRVLEFTVNESIKALKNVTMNEEFFTGHFPNEPIMPGVLIIESIAQSCAILAIKTFQAEHPNEDVSGKSVYFMSIDNAKFRRKVVPGDTLIHNIKITKNKRRICKFSATSFVGDEIACEADIMAMIGDK